MSLERLRNIGIVAHIDAGKTTVSERILYYSGVERRMGEVHEGSTVMDWMEEERERGITITAAATTVPWRSHTLNLIDTPGHVDFTVEVERCMRVLDGAVLVVNGVAGVQAQSETVWRQMLRHHVRSIAFVNQMDRPGADFLLAVESLRERLGIEALPIQFPLGSERGLRAVVDLLANEALEFPEATLGRDPQRGAVPASVADEVGVLRAELLERLAEEDEECLRGVVEGLEIPLEVLRRALRRAVLRGAVLPVLCGAALRNVGIQPLLDAVVDYLPSPLEVPPVRGFDPSTQAPVERAPDPAGPVCALAFKWVADPNEDLLYARVYAGRVRPGDKLFNPRVRRMERIARVLRMHANTRHALAEAGPGEIVALTGCKLTATGDTLCEHDAPIVLERLAFPDPVISQVVEPRSSADRDRLRQALERLSFEDPSFHVREDEETGQWLVQGMGELHLEIKEHRLQREFGLEVKIGAPRVAYREAPLGSGRGAGRVDRVLGGTRIFGAVEVEVRSRPDGSPQPIHWSEECPIPDRLRPAVESALEVESRVGPRFGFPLTALEVEVVGGETHPERDSEIGFTQAASAALREAVSKAGVALLEPVMAFEIEAPAEYMSGILGELNSKHADIREVSADGTSRRVAGSVPLFHMFGYATTLRSLSQGRASFSLAPAGFRPVPEGELGARGLVWS
jgi:elongation factor G